MASRQLPTHLKDFIYHTVASQDPVLSPFYTTSLGTPYLIFAFLSYNKFSTSHQVFLAAITLHNDDKCLMHTSF